MKSKIPKSTLPLGLRCLGVATIAFGGLLLGSQPTFATNAGETAEGEGLCMQKIFLDYLDETVVKPKNRLNCTANDIQLSQALSVSPASCTQGETFDLTATFETIVTANERFDAAFFFRIDGGVSARGDDPVASGICSLSRFTVPAPAGSDSPALDLDGDTCGDLNSGTYDASGSNDTITFTIEDVFCDGVPNPNGSGNLVLKLPNCTSTLTILF